MWNFAFFCQKIDHGCVFILSFFFQGWSYRLSDSKKSWKGSFCRKLKVLVPFLSYQKIGGHLGPLPRSFSPKVTGSKFRDSYFIHHSRKNQITISLGTTYSLTVPMGGAASYKLWPLFTYTNCYWEVYRHL